MICTRLKVGRSAHGQHFSRLRFKNDDASSVRPVFGNRIMQFRTGIILDGPIKGQNNVRAVYGRLNGPVSERNETTRDIAFAAQESWRAGEFLVEISLDPVFSRKRAVLSAPNETDHMASES